MYGHAFREIREKLDQILGLLRKKIRIFQPATSILIYGGNMSLGITAGGALLTVQLVPLPSGTSFDQPADLELTCDDPNVVIADHPGDTTGTLFDVSTPATDTATSANLDATGNAGGVAIAGTAVLAITPATVISTDPATSIGIVPAPVAAPAALRRPAAAVAGAPRMAPAATPRRA